MHINLLALLQAVGYLGIFAIIFAESGLFFAFFLPGDSLLFSAGILSSRGIFSLPAIIITVMVASVLGGLFGYFFGRKLGDALFTRKDSLLFKKRHLERTSAFYEKHGSKTVVIARFVPIVRTFAPIIAGASLMHHRKFLLSNAIGGIAWSIAIPTAGYFLGSRIPNVDAYILPLIVGVVGLSLLPVAYHVIKEKYSK